MNNCAPNCESKLLFKILMNYSSMFTHGKKLQICWYFYFRVRTGSQEEKQISHIVQDKATITMLLNVMVGSDKEYIL